MYPWLGDAIEREAIIITASHRLARELAEAYAGQQLESGTSAWLTPRIHAITDWCRMQFDLHADSQELPIPLDEFSAAILWDRCLRAQVPEVIPGYRGLLRQARDAWRRLVEWNVPLAEVTAAAQSLDEQLFARAASAYRKLLDASGWTDVPGMPRRLADLIRKQEAGAPRAVVLAGFDRLTPAVSDLVDALQAKGCEVATAPDPGTTAEIRVASFEDHDAELRSAGAWAREILQKAPSARIAIVSPVLQEDADRSTRLVREGLAPGWQYAGPAHVGAVNVSYGRRLAEYPAIAAALTILKWLASGLSAKEISLLLRSRCLASKDTAGRSRLELELRQLPDRAWSAVDLRQCLRGKDDSADARAWFRGVDALIELQKEAQREAAPEYWASRIDALLEVWNWPCGETLTSVEFQLVNRWRKLLNEFVQTARVQPVLRLAESSERLAALAEEVIFQPETEAGLVSLLGILEAAGMQFDYLWITGLHAGQWPPAGKPSAMLSRGLQKEYGMPDATPADTLAFARRVLHRLAGAAPGVVLSWPHSDDEAELTASSLIDELSPRPLDGICDPGWHAVGLAGEHQLQAVKDDPAPPVTSDETVRGGAYTVQRQVVEPFAAFVYGRLGVLNLEPIEAGIAPRIRGNIVHNALHTLLSDCPSQADVCNWSVQEIDRRLGSAIDAALARPMRYAGEATARLFGLERARLFSLLRRFIAAESEREPFVVEGVEASARLEASGVRLDLRIDRVDRLADGTLLIVDYKTGTPRNLLDQHGDPTDLQLVVYAGALQQEIGGLVFVNLDSRAISYKGTGGSVEWDVARRDDWPQRLQSWLDEVHGAIDEFAAGDVRINLLRKAGDARPLASLSRFEELKRAQ